MGDFCQIWFKTSWATFPHMLFHHWWGVMKWHICEVQNKTETLAKHTIPFPPKGMACQRRFRNAWGLWKMSHSVTPPPNGTAYQRRFRIKTGISLLSQKHQIGCYPRDFWLQSLELKCPSVCQEFQYIPAGLILAFCCFHNISRFVLSENEQKLCFPQDFICAKWG